MITRYCLPIIKDTKKEVKKHLKIKGYDFYEIWLDNIKDLDERFILEIASKYKNRLIFVFRKQNINISLLSEFNGFIDIDFLSQYKELELIKNFKKAKLILSFHNYKETPKIDYLINLINKMRMYSPYIIKISTFCQKDSDGLNLLNLLLKLKQEKLRYIVLGMGKKGLITRIFGAIWGNQITFAPVTLKGKSAEGQLTKKQMENILKELN